MSNKLDITARIELALIKIACFILIAAVASGVAGIVIFSAERILRSGQ